MNIPLDNPLFLIPTMTGFIFVIAGFVMLLFPPKEINFLYGYRTKSSMKNKKRWIFAQKYAATEMIKLGGLLTLSGLIGFIYNPPATIAVFLGLGLMIIVVVLLIIRVEKAIKNKFSADK